MHAHCTSQREAITRNGLFFSKSHCALFCPSDTWFLYERTEMVCGKPQRLSACRQMGILLLRDQDLLGRWQHNCPRAWALILLFMWP